MNLTRAKARLVGCAAVGGILLLQAVNSFRCYDQDFTTYLKAVMIFLGAPLLPALLSIGLLNPLRAVGACALIAPWLVLAYYIDCVRPYSGGGASMIYIAVLLYGTPSSIVGALIAPWLMRWVGIQVVER